MPVYRLLYDLARRVEKETRGFPSDFKWLRSQVCRSSESAFANMREGFYSQYSTEYLQSLFRSRREAEESVGHLTYARDAEILEVGKADSLVSDYNDALGQTAGLISSIERKIATKGKGKPGHLCESACHYVDSTGENLP
mgnify:CR=1 FL=1